VEALVLGKKKTPRPLFSQRRRPSRRIPVIWIVVGLLFLVFWLVPVYGTPLDYIVGRTPLSLRFTPPPTSTSTPKPTPAHGGRIVFTCTRADFNQLCLVNADGTGLQQLSADQFANDYYPSFSPQGNSVLFASNRNGLFDIYLMMFGERSIAQITSGVGDVISPDFSPDGRQIVFANRPADATTSIWMVKRDGSDPHLFYAGSGPIVAVAWSPNGKTLAYAMQLDIPNQYEIFLINLDGSNQRRLTNGLSGIGGSISWSPDSASLLISAGPVGGKEIYRVDVASGAATQITNGGNNAAPSWSPDGHYIVFNSPRNANQSDIFIMNADGSSQRQVTNDPEPDWQPRWEP
jgi:TolB protein